MIDSTPRPRRKRRVLPGTAYVHRLNAPKRALTQLTGEIERLSEEDCDRLILAQRALSIRGPVLIIPNALRAMQIAAEADIRRIWSKYHADVPMETI